MAEKADYTGKIRGKGLTGTGITEQVLGKHHRAKGGRVMIVASASVAAVHEDVATGTGGVDYVLDDLEVAPAMAEEHVRELVRSFNYERKLEQEGPMLDDDGLTPAIGDAVEAGKAYAEHPFLPTDAAEESPDCEVCGLGENAAAHRAYAAEHPEESDPDDGDVGGQDDTESGEEPDGKGAAFEDPFEVPADLADRTQTEELPVP